LTLGLLVPGLFVLGAVLAGLLAAPAHAQPRPFSTVSLYAGGSVPVRTGALAAFYHSSPGFDLVAAAPFYVGVAGLDAGLRRYEQRPGRADEDLWAAPVALRWGVRPSLPVGGGGGGLRAEASARLGALLMRFSGGSAGLRNESELLMGADAGLSLRVAGRWEIVAGLRYERVFTSTPLHLWQVRAGVRRRFEAPRWLQTLLR
jgi:hypothetical protein